MRAKRVAVHRRRPVQSIRGNVPIEPHEQVSRKQRPLDRLAAPMVAAPDAGERAIALVALALQVLNGLAFRIRMRGYGNPDSIRLTHRPLLQECRYQEP